MGLPVLWLPLAAVSRSPGIFPLHVINHRVWPPSLKSAIFGGPSSYEISVFLERPGSCQRFLAPQNKELTSQSIYSAMKSMGDVHREGFENRQVQLIAVTSTCLALSTVAVILRLLVRSSSSATFWWDDWVAVLALVSSFKPPFAEFNANLI